jgi:hypothetical protein
MGRGVIVTLAPDVSNVSSGRWDLDFALDFFRPKPSPFRLIRVGGKRDGAYLLPDDLDGISACFSPGVANRKEFEDEILKTRGIRSYMVDFSSDESNFRTPLEPGAQFFDKKWLAPNNSDNSISLASWVGTREPKSSSLLLQMDIEGAEYANLATVPDSVLAQFRILVIEFHDFFDKLTALPGDAEFANVLDRLSKHFRVVHARPNNCCPSRPLPSGKTEVPAVIEVTFLRLDRFELRSPNRMLPVKIPHPRDVSRNVIYRPPLHLGASWVGGKRPVVSRLKVLTDWFSWFLYDRVRHWPYRAKRKLAEIFAPDSIRNSSGPGEKGNQS